jgi:outer membrane protein insertion porin family
MGLKKHGYFTIEAELRFLAECRSSYLDGTKVTGILVPLGKQFRKGERCGKWRRLLILCTVFVILLTMNRILLILATIAALLAVIPDTIAQTSPNQPSSSKPRVLIAEIVVSGVTGELENIVYDAIQAKPGRTITKAQLQEDIQRIFATGQFAQVRAEPQDTPLGVRITFVVEPNPVLQKVVVTGQTKLPESVTIAAFQAQYGNTLNLRQFQTGIEAIQKWYQDQGYAFAQVIDAPKISPEGVATIEVAEGEIEDIQLKFLDDAEQDKDTKGNPIRGRTRDFVITREMESKVGSIFNRETVQRDMQRVASLRLFKDLKLTFEPGQDPRQVVLVVQPIEKKNILVSPGFNWSSRNGFSGTAIVQADNLGGNNQNLNASIEAGSRNFGFDVGFTDPWIAGDPFRTSYTVRGFRQQSTSLNFEGGENPVRLSNGDRPRILRTGGGISFNRPLSKQVFQRAEWTASLGLQYQQIDLQDADRNRVTQDALGNELTASGQGRDTILSIPFALTYDKRNDGMTPTQGSLLRLSSDQSIPIGQSSIFSNSLRASYSTYLPTKLTKFTPGCRKANSTANECPQAFAFNLTGGTVIGDLPPYNASFLGGTNSVRGYEDGEVGSARSFVQATAEYRFPIFSLVNGALFVDAATDLGTGSSVIGDPAGARRKPGSGFGYGVGARINSPLGPIRIDYGWNDRGDNRIHFGFGERF